MEAVTRTRIAWAVVAALAVFSAVLLIPRMVEGPPVASVVSPVAVVTVEASAMPAAVASPTSTPTPTPTPSAVPSPSEVATETVLFEGGPARGPWQQLGTVAELTHPGAPVSARYSWSNFWSDPEEENQPDALWDALVIEVTDQLVELGDPVDRPAFGGAEGSEPFNSFGGLQDIYEDREAFTASWSGVFSDGASVAVVYVAFLISFDGEVIRQAPPLIYEEDGGRTFEDNARESYAWIRDWAASQGYTGCVRC